MRWLINGAKNLSEWIFGEIIYPIYLTLGGGQNKQEEEEKE